MAETHPGADWAQQPESSREGPRPRPGKPRECWICKDKVYPTYIEPNAIDKLRGIPPKRVYEDESGRLICPCNCSGSVKWVHESCIQEWRYSQAGTQNQWRCPNCHFEYRFERMDWARRFRSPALAFLLAIGVVVTTVFLLGFVADHILNLWIDPAATIYEVFGGETDDWDLDFENKKASLGIPEIDENSWGFHFLKGLFSLGLVGFVKAFLAMSPFQWWNLRTSGIVGGGAGRRGGTGRERLENISWTLVVIGAMTFFWMVWTGTRRWTTAVLDRASERMVNIQPDDDDDDVHDDDDDGEGGNIDDEGQDTSASTPESREEERAKKYQ